jgi:hypothetical protein
MSPLCFWHPVGPHAGESLEGIVLRKQREIAAHGYTLWSFTPATVERVEAWRHELRGRGLTICAVICCGDATVDPHDGMAAVHWMSESSDDARTWAPIPTDVTSYHRAPGRNGIVASGFTVTAVDAPAGMRVARPTRWLRANERRWEDTPVPTRGEYLVAEPARSSNGRTVRLMLRVRDPFVVWLR